MNIKTEKLVRIQCFLFLPILISFLLLIKVIDKHHVDDYDQDSIDDMSFLFNGVKKRKLSTDSNDSNPNRSQRVPDLTLPKIKENGIHKNEHKTARKHSKQTQHILTVTKVQT
ncbi:unnamed protein product [Rotaria magnacalcarata]|uniref:Uncharacterized protein n=1 Tax=Rotaria magnacalcarata TaxID=392030 RepID=A0A8S3I890_9BILA|nr:unnamed protein product [Rotaria magnacalcarata]